MVALVVVPERYCIYLLCAPQASGSIQPQNCKLVPALHWEIKIHWNLFFLFFGHIVDSTNLFLQFVVTLPLLK